MGVRRSVAVLLAVLSLAGCSRGGTTGGEAGSGETAAKSGAGQGGATEASSAQDKDAEALVLGVRDPDGSLRTLFIDASGIVPIGRGVAVPRKDGWWKADLTRQERPGKDGQFEQVTFWAVRPGQTAQLEPMEEAASCTQDEKLTVLFIGNDYASLEVESGGYCEGAAHPWALHNLMTVPLDKTGGEAVGINAAIGPEAQARLKTDGTSHKAKKVKELGDAGACLEDANPQNWGVIRSRGRWVVRGGLSHDAEACRGLFEAYTVQMPSPTKLVSHDKLPQPWEQYANAVPGLTDVLASPSGKTLVYVTKEGLQLQHDGKRVAELASPGSAVVLAQWAVGGANVERWRKEAAATLN